MEYDPERGRAFVSGTVGASCDHERMLAHVRCPVLLTHHVWSVDEATGNLGGALSSQQAAYAQKVIRSAGQAVEYQTFPTMPHAMHRADPELFAGVVTEWAERLSSEAETRRAGIFATS
jgi:pimeloyl-ACP methyl ester carboxylesterase